MQFIQVLSLCVVIMPVWGQSETSFQSAKAQIIEQTNALLNDWYPRIIDDEGGFVTNYTYDWRPGDFTPKMIVSQSRGLWTAARGFEYNTHAALLEAAEHGYRYLTTTMWDSIHGGFLQYDQDAHPDSTRTKMAYGNAFAIYALSQFAKINPGNSEILEWCQRSLDWLDEAARDPERGGYYNLITRDGRSANRKDFDSTTLTTHNWGEHNWKDQNSSIHLLEAFTTLYSVMHSVQARDRLEEMLLLVRDLMVHPKGYLHLYFDKNWVPVENRDQGRDYILEHIRHDHVSFGHDIETAYLLIDAAQKLYDTLDHKTLAIAKKLVDHTLDHGFDQNYYGLLDKGYYFTIDGPIEVVDSNKVWWSQAEAWHTLILFSELFPDEKRYAIAAQGMWKYIMEQMIDHERGGWYNAGLDVNPDNEFKDKAHQWKSCYHDGRALMQVAGYFGGN